MSDFDSSLPVRTEAPGDVDINISDAVTPSQKLVVEADGSINVNADLDSSEDSVEVLQDTHDDLNANANLQVGDVDVANGNPVPVSDAGGSLTVDAVDLDIRDLDSASDSVEVLQDTHDDLNCNANLQFEDADVTSTNPLPVVLASDQQGTEICEYNTSAAVASDASVNHDYTVSASTVFLGEEAWVSGSAKLKVELLVNGATKFVGFNSTANPNVRIPLEKILKGAAAEVIRMTITNRDNQAQDLYSTLLGLEVAV